MDSWFASKENFDFITAKQRHFIAALKDNRLVALSEEDKRKKRFVRVVRRLQARSVQVLVENPDPAHVKSIWPGMQRILDFAASERISPGKARCQTMPRWVQKAVQRTGHCGRSTGRLQRLDHE